MGPRSEHRNLTKGEKAMRLALLYPEPEKRGRGNKLNDEKIKKLNNIGGTINAAKARLSQARAVLAYSLELAAAVRDQPEPLSRRRSFAGSTSQRPPTLRPSP